MSMSNSRNGRRNRGDRAGALIIQGGALFGLVAAILIPFFVEREFATDWRILLVLALIALGADAPQVIRILAVVFNRGGSVNTNDYYDERNGNGG